MCAAECVGACGAVWVGSKARLWLCCGGWLSVGPPSQPTTCAQLPFPQPSQPSGPGAFPAPRCPLCHRPLPTCPANAPDLHLPWPALPWDPLPLPTGILANMLVCLAVWLANSSRDAAGKILGIYLPIMAFTAIGLEHCIANMWVPGWAAGRCRGLGLSKTAKVSWELCRRADQRRAP